ncbi:MAG: NAD-dependent epimerase/dehydratase family protein, partial [Phycisphaerales bacterium]
MAQVVLVTGGRGFFGRPLAEAIGRHGYEVATPGRPDFDLMDRTSVDKTLLAVRPDIVVHSAAYYGGLGICMAEPARIFHRNVLMTVNLLDAAAEAGVRRFVSISSACAYAGNITGDMREEDFWAGPLHPSVEAYGFTKKVQQVGLNAYARQFGLKGQIQIITNLYGENDVFAGNRPHVVAALIKRFSDAVEAGADQVVCWGTGAPVREFLYVGDAAEAVARLIENGSGEPLNIGTGVGTSIRQLAALVARSTGFDGKVVWDATKPDGVMRKVLDVSKMKEALGWEPPTSLEAGLEKTIQWYLANKEEADARP